MNRIIVFKSVMVVTALLVTYFSIDILNALSFSLETLPENVYLKGFLWRLLDYSVLLLVGCLLFWKHLPILLGMRHSLAKSFAFACVLPMFIIFPFYFEMNLALDVIAIFNQVLLPAFFEELAFRALVFGALFGFCRWPFWPAVLINGIVFGLSHLYQAHDLTGAIKTFSITFIGAVWFSWLYVKWNYNLYIPYFLHMLMNFSWLLFEVSPGAAGNTVANVTRLLTIFLSIYFTFYLRHQKLPFSWKNFKVIQDA
ncbi:type II CAAX endopeptidase family protein [Catalinimonas sp. 4WD22]|uniref:CPBP family intramembrane glutamic endopeptidase n=1 Tax=Catalinimonas locisalis TaxID=3133978 RepID=UPI003101207E